MSENQKRLLIIGFVVIVALILFMRGNNSTVTNVSNGEEIPLQNVSAPAINISGRAPFVLPNLGDFNSATNLSAIGACCADCSNRGNSQSYRESGGPRYTFVTNMGNRGPNVFNYINLPESQRPVMTIVRQRG